MIDDNKRASMTINERERSSHTPLYGISPVSRGFAQPLKSTCRNIFRVRAKYVQRMLEVMGPIPLGGGVIIEERSECSWYIIEKYSKIQKQSFLQELIFQKLQNFNFF